VLLGLTHFEHVMLCGNECQSAEIVSAADRSSWEPPGNPVYFRDERVDPPICFAYLWAGGANGGPALSTVDCCRVEGLLVNGPPNGLDCDVQGH